MDVKQHLIGSIKKKQHLIGHPADWVISFFSFVTFQTNNLTSTLFIKNIYINSSKKKKKILLQLYFPIHTILWVTFAYSMLDYNNNDVHVTIKN